MLHEDIDCIPNPGKLRAWLPCCIWTGPTPWRAAGQRSNLSDSAHCPNPSEYCLMASCICQGGDIWKIVTTACSKPVPRF